MKKGAQQKKAAKQSSSPAKSSTGSNSTWQIVFCLALTLIAYLPAFNGSFLNWDDDYYVTLNSAVQKFELRELLTKPVQGNYHPLTMFTLAVNYSLSGIKPWSYHFLNIVLHLLNTFLVFRLMLKLTRDNNIISLTSSLLFGVHPMHVESVAWISERKDVLYSFFFLLGLISYLRYLDSGKRSAYYITLLWFLLSLASKPAAVIFPIVLLIFDFFRKGKLSAPLILEKIPFIIIAAVFAYLALHGQEGSGARNNATYFPVERRMLFASFGYMMYFVKMIFPSGLASFYPLPAIDTPLPLSFILSPVFFIATLALCFFTRKKFPEITFGFAFYFINLLLVLQFIVIGSAVMADRYTYIPYIGLFFIAGWLLEKKFRHKTMAAYSIIITIGIIFSSLTYLRAQVWKNSQTLWDNAIENAPSEQAYFHRAIMLREEGNIEKALEYYTKAIMLNDASYSAHCNRGNIFAEKGQDSLALVDYNKALEVDSSDAKVFTNRAGIYVKLKQYPLAEKDFEKAFALNPTLDVLFRNRALYYKYINENEKAIADIQTYLKTNPGDAKMISTAGQCFQNLKQFEESVKWFSRAIELDPGNGMYWANRSFSESNLGEMDKAREDILKAQQLGTKANPVYLQQLGLPQ